ncbi:hypothetical protein [Kitasatospora mediocidica]|uniref:hypothetical protein n=1 Tax=Kitasatospora mediocidica TaxID=58352 RepID=UPI00055CC35C|nr:hypothetical protein [Kitasatospora mediocidica]
MNTGTTGTTGTTGATSRGLRLALRAYPAAYRAECGEEITAVHADCTEGAGRLATARETAGVAAYGLRVRTGLTASGTGGRLLATTAPLATALALGRYVPGLWYFPQSWRQAVVDPSLGMQEAAGGPLVDWRPELITSAMPGVLWLLVVVAALFRRWTAARILAAMAGVAVITDCLVRTHIMRTWAEGSAPDYGNFVLWGGAGVVWSLLVLATPGDLLDSTVPRRPRAAVLPVLLLLPGVLQSKLHAITNPEAMLSVVCIPLALLSLAFLRWGRLLPAATGLAVLPMALGVVVPGYLPSTGDAGWDARDWVASDLVGIDLLGEYVLAVTLAVLVTAAAVRYLKHTADAPGPLGTA